MECVPPNFYIPSFVNMSNDVNSGKAIKISHSGFPFRHSPNTLEFPFSNQAMT